MTDKWQLMVKEEFSAAHALRNYEGKCEKLHGHNFMVEVCVEGEILDPNTGMLLDFKILKNKLKTVLDGLDHCILNDLAPFDQINPSSENIARFIWKQMFAELEKNADSKAGNVRLASIGVSEKSTQKAVYMGNG